MTDDKVTASKSIVGEWWGANFEGANVLVKMEK
jgi:hypothetical protein